MPDSPITIDLRTDPKAENIRSLLAPFVEAMRELAAGDCPERLEETRYADIIRYHRPWLSAKRIAREVLTKKQLAESLRDRPEIEAACPITVRSGSNGQYLLIDGAHRAAAWMAMGRPVPARVQEPMP